jgi:hypothetical protein
MNYKKIHNNIIDKRRALGDPSGYSELHHILPRSLGGSDAKDNLIRLTAREHFLVHFLLWKMQTEIAAKRKMAKAFNFMVAAGANQQRYFNSRLYEASRKDRSEAISESQSGSGNSQYGTKWIFRFDPVTFEGLEERKIGKEEEIPEGWYAGRKTKKVRRCKNSKCFNPVMGVKKKVYCSAECREKSRPLPMVVARQEEWVPLFLKGYSMDRALIEIGIIVGSSGDHAGYARQVLRERGLEHLIKYGKV